MYLKFMPEVLLNDDADVLDEVKVLTGDEVQIMLEYRIDWATAVFE